ncbi:MAG: hypothetical protein IPP71_13675 [Bacteroidetes bacterium]|nr:hypothetical protein [Bacteroidota bacterium]
MNICNKLCFTIFLFIGLPFVLLAQEEEANIPSYSRPDFKVFRSLSAALQQPDSVFILELKGKKLTEIPEGVLSCLI